MGKCGLRGLVPILALWRRTLKAERKTLLPAPGAPDSEASAARRVQIAYDLKHLNTWDEGVHTIEIELSASDHQA